MRKSSGWKGSATITRLRWEVEILERIEPRGADSRVNHQNDARETGKSIPLRWRRGWERGSRSGWICEAMAEEQEDRVARVARRSESQAGARKSRVDRDRVMNLGMISLHPLRFIHFILWSSP